MSYEYECLIRGMMFDCEECGRVPVDEVIPDAFRDRLIHERCGCPVEEPKYLKEDER